MDDTYRTLRGSSAAELKVKGSRFIAEAKPVEDRAAATRTIAEVRRREHGATHHCSAFRLGPEGDDFRYDDDGEPSGTAGQPILRQIDGRELTNVIVIVTRYYGGTKLGTGGLARAYADAAAAALEAGEVVEKVLRASLRLRFSYDDTSPARRLLERYDAVEQEAAYTDETELIVGVRRGQVDRFVEAFTNALGGRGELERLG